MGEEQQQTGEHLLALLPSPSLARCVCTVNHSGVVEMIELMRLTEIPLFSVSAEKQFKIDFEKIKLDKLPMQS